MLSIELSYDLIKNNIGFLFLSILGLVFLIMYILILKNISRYNLFADEKQNSNQSPYCRKVVYFNQGMGLQKFVDKLFCTSSFIAIHDLHYRT